MKRGNDVSSDRYGVRTGQTEFRRSQDNEKSVNGDDRSGKPGFKRTPSDLRALQENARSGKVGQQCEKRGDGSGMRSGRNVVG